MPASPTDGVPADVTRIALLGVGLIGGSLGLAWKARRADLTIVGYDDPEVLRTAAQRGAIDEGAASVAEAVAEADLVVLAAPLAPLLRLLEAAAPHLHPDALVTDVGSVKQPVLDRARDVLPAPERFLGGHPMAGAEKGGIEHADALLFESATWVLCPPPNVPESDVRRRFAPVISLVEATGARPLLLEAGRHDRIAAAVSHLPQLLAVTLAGLAAELDDADDAVLRLAAGGFRDMTRIASSPFPMWRDILTANHGPILDVLGAFAAALQRTRGRIAEEDLEALASLFDRARGARERTPRNSKGFLRPLADVYVYVEDRPGILLGITRTLFDAGLDIKDIELLKIREGTGGAFRLSLTDDAAADAAVAALDAAGHVAYRL